MTNPTRQIGEAVERAARVVEHFRTRAYGWSAEQFEVWFTEDPLFCQKVNEWGGFRGTEKQKLLHETRLALEAAMPNTSQPGTEERSDEVKPKASDLSTITRQMDEARDENASWLLRLADIREAAGVSAKPMLSELPEAIATIRSQRDELREALIYARYHVERSPCSDRGAALEKIDAALATVEDKP